MTSCKSSRAYIILHRYVLTWLNPSVSRWLTPSDIIDQHNSPIINPHFLAGKEKSYSSKYIEYCPNYHIIGNISMLYEETINIGLKKLTIKSNQISKILEIENSASQGSNPTRARNHFFDPCCIVFQYPLTLHN